MMFGKLSEIDINKPDSFKKIFLTFDIDWASDEVLDYCLKIVESAKVKATWFVTHKTPLLERILSNPLFDVGIHPNFNPLLEGDFCYGSNYKEVLKYYLDIVPNAKIMRSHSLGLSSRILIEAKNLGITHESNICIPYVAMQNILEPFVNWDGIVRCPYHFADDVACMYENKIRIGELLSRMKQENGYFMFGFHPIHIFLNTESLERYERARGVNGFKELQKLAGGGALLGARNILERILGR